MTSKEKAKGVQTGFALFDRLVLASQRPLPYHRIEPTLVDHRQAILLDLNRLFSTRRVTTEMLSPGDANTLDYGLPSFTALSPASNQDLLKLQGLLENAIEAFEPRLSRPRVQLQATPGKPGRVEGELSARTFFQGIDIPFNLSMSMDMRDGAAVLDEIT